MSKFLLNLLLQISKALPQSKINFLFGKEFFFTFSPAASRPVRPLSPATLPGAPLPRVTHARSAHPGLRGLGVIAKSRLFFEFAQPNGYAFPSVTATRAPLVSSVVSPAPPTPVGISPRRRFPRAIASRLGCPRAFTALLITFPS
jgi:hypothetical protein